VKAVLDVQLNRPLQIGIRRNIKISLSIEVKQIVDFVRKEIF
jgi:hypothetical protein